jgi:DNA-binding CsgD family transcriptional regulator/tetratricopeptide (TPR) repeat protein
MDGIRSDAFVGRDEELAAYSELLDRVLQGRGHVLLTDGEPGIGKSALLRAQLRLARSYGCTVLAGHADDLTQQFPMRVVLDCLGGDSAMGVSSQALPTPEQVITIVANLCAQSPVVLAIDDLHWADDPSLLTWRRLSEMAPDLPLIVMGTWAPMPHRPELAMLKDRLASAGQAVASLGPIDQDEVTRLVGVMAGGEPSDRLRRLAERAGGNPLYVTELVNALVQGERLRVADGIADIVAGHQPQTLAVVITERLNFLSPRSNRVLRFAALLGRHFAAAEVAAVAGLTMEDVGLGLAEAQEARVIAETDGRFSFRHLLIRRALYDSMPSALRVALHRQAAQSLAEAGAAEERVAEQLLATTRMTTTPYIRDWLAEAGPRLTRQVPGMAAELLQQAIADLAPGDPRRDQLEGALAAALLRLGRYKEAVDVGWPLLVMARAHDPSWRGELVCMLGNALLGCDRDRKAVELITATIADPAISLAWRARLRATAAFIQALAGRPREALVTAEHALAEARQADDRYTASHALHTLALLRVQQADNVAARDLTSQALALVSGEPDSTDLHSSLLVTRMTAWQELGEMAAADADLRAAWDLVGQGDIPAQLAYAAAEYYLRIGRWDEALDQVESVTGMPLLIGYPAPGRGDPLRRGITALIAGHRDDRTMAAVLLSKDSSAHGMVPGHAAYLVVAEALAAERDGRQAEGLTVLLPALGTVDPAAARLRTLCLPTLVRLALEGNRTHLANMASSVAEQAASQELTPIRRAIAEHCRGLLVGDPRLVLAAAATYRDIGLTLEHAQAAEDAAELLATAGQTAQARQFLTEAIDGYAALGADWDIRRADTRLRRFGVRRGRGRSPGTDSLTRTEAKIAQLIAQGWSTPDIARDLMLSPRTVQTHVSHILRKLNGRSRIDIVRASINARTPGDLTSGLRPTIRE